MRLLDRVAASTKPARCWSPRVGAFEAPSAALVAVEARSAPVRYVLEDDVAALVMGSALRDAAQIAACIDLLRVPAPLMWIEWNERGALRAMAELGACDPCETARSAHVGMLIRADPCGRRGEVHVVWDSEAPEPDLSPFVLEFDLDDPTFGARPHPQDLTRFVQIPEDEHLTRLLAHVRFRLRPEWRRNLERAAFSPAARDAEITKGLNAAAGDFPFLAAFCLVMSAKSALDLVPASLDRLNAARARKAKPPLLDHIQVIARLGVSDASAPARRAVTRAQARLHFVCGHLVRRSGRIFWRRAHMRGNPRRGIIAARTISVLTPLRLHA